MVQLTHADPAQIGPETFLKDVGIDSLLTVELAEELGRRYDVYLSDETVDGLRTVQDAVRAVESHRGTAMPGGAVAGVAATSLDDTDPPVDGRALKSGAISTAMSMTVIGAVIGGVLGFGVMTAMSATGLDEAALPPLSASPTPEPTKSSTPPPTTEAPQDDAVPRPVLTTPKDRVAPGERFTLAGTFPGAGEGAQLQVQVKDGDTPWDDFPVTAPVRAGDTFETQVYTSRTGTRQFRMLLIGTDRATPEVTVTIG